MLLFISQYMLIYRSGMESELEKLSKERSRTFSIWEEKMGLVLLRHSGLKGPRLEGP